MKTKKLLNRFKTHLCFLICLFGFQLHGNAANRTPYTPDSILFTVGIIIIILFIMAALLLISTKSLKAIVKKQNSKLKESEENLKITLNSIGEAMITTDIHGNIMRMNPIAEKLTGYTFGEAKRKPIQKIFQLVNPKTGKPIHNLIDQIMEEKRIVNLDRHVVLKSKNGQQYQISESGAPILDLSSHLVGAVLIFKDVSKEYHLQEKIACNERRYRSIIELSNDAIYLIENGKFEIVNQKFIDLFGFSRKEVIHSKFDITDLTNSIGKEIIREHRAAVNQEKTYSDQFEIEGITKEEKIINLLISENHQRTQENHIIQGTIRDITQQKKNERDLIRAKEKAEESDRLKSAFLSNMSHEIRTPMNGIIGFSNLLKSNELTPENQKRYIDLIERSSRRMINTLDDLMDIAMIESGQTKMTYSKTNLNQLFTSIWEEYQAKANLKNVELHFETKNKLVSIDTDKKKLYYILKQLVDNAIKYTHEGEVKFGYCVKDQEVSCYVKDTGVGIPGDKIDSIFKRFVKVDSNNSILYDGSGLGLAITKAYVELLKGRIGVMSAEGKGSKFYFSVPVKVKSQIPEEVL